MLLDISIFDQYYLSNYYLLADIILALIVIILAIVFFAKEKLTWRYFFISLFVVALLVTTYFLKMPVSFIIIAASTVLFTIALSVLTTKKEKQLLFRTPVQSHHKEVLSTNETEVLIKKLVRTVTDLSSTKTGALITIEMSDSMNSFMETSGVEIDAPVSPELLETIFFNKTPLHDGACIIKGDMIVKAAVFYQPTQKALSGKYGSRHRAAIGISEVCDALTIVVSEETGKVSFAYKGELIPTPLVNFEENLREYF